jgi:hypothetical protein
MLPNSYAIQVEKDTTDKTTNTALTKIHLTAFQLANAEQSMIFMPSKDDDEKEAKGIPATVSINEIVEQMAHEINPICVTYDTTLNVTWEPKTGVNNAATDVKLLEDPLTKFRGPGLGPRGMLPCYCSFTSLGSIYRGNTPGNAIGDSPVSGQPDEYIFAQVRINKADVPNIKKNDLLIFMSSKVNLYRDDFAGTGTKAYFAVSGPMFIATDIDAQCTHSFTAASNNATLQSPVKGVRLYCKGSMYKKGGTVYMDHKGDDPADKPTTAHSLVTDLAPWYKDMGDHYMFYLSGLPTAEANDLAGARTLISNTDPGATDSYRYHIYRESNINETDIFELITAQVKVDATSKTDQLDTFSTAEYVAANSKTRVTTTRRPTLGDPVPCFTPLDMFERFNTGWMDSAPIQMQTDPNGGFRITVLEDGISTLRVSTALLYDMGLNVFLTQEGVVAKSHPANTTHEFKLVLVELHRIDLNPSVYKWQDDYGNPSTIQSHMTIGNMEEFTIFDPQTQVPTFPVTKDTALPAYVVQESSGKFYRALAKTSSTITQTEVTNQDYEGGNYISSDGLEYIEWNLPMKGAYIGNDNQVSVGSFSIYENIRLVATGFGFQPFIVARADQPVLCELRLPFSNSASLVSGSGANQMTLTNTSSEFYGDIIYEAPASGHQYLRLNSQQPIYDMTIEPRLIPRDPDLPQERVMLGFSDVFQVKLRFLMRN